MKAFKKTIISKECNWLLAKKIAPLFIALTLIIIFLLCLLMTKDLHPVVDDGSRISHSKWIESIFFTIPSATSSHEKISPNFRYGTLLVIPGIIIQKSLLLVGIKINYIWILHSLSAFSLILTYAITYFILCKSGFSKKCSLIAIIIPLCSIQITANSLINVKDAPAANMFLLSSVILWTLLIHKPWTRNPILYGATLATLGMIVFLARVPILLQSAVVFMILIKKIISSLDQSSKEKNTRFFVHTFIFFITVSLLILYIFYPPFRFDLVREKTDALLIPIEYFDNYNEKSFWKKGQRSQQNFYFPIKKFIENNSLFLLFIISTSFISSTKNNLKNLHFNSLGKKLKTLEFFLITMSFLAFVQIGIMKPDFTFSGRHILFLYPPILLVTGLQLRHVSNKIVNPTIIALVFITTFHCYHWGKYSYTFKNHFFISLAQDNRKVCYFTRVAPYIRKSNIQTIKAKYTWPIRQSHKDIIYFEKSKIEKGDYFYFDLHISENIKKVDIQNYKNAINRSTMLAGDYFPNGELICGLFQVTK